MFKSIAEAQQELQTVRTHRLTLESEARQMEKREAIIEAWLIQTMEPEKEYASDTCIISRYSKPKFGIANKPKLHGWVRDKDDFSILITRINERVAKEYRENKIKVPGLVAEEIDMLSYRSV